MDAAQLQRFLCRHHACGAAVEWAKGKDLASAWQNCERADWMLWLCGKMIRKRGWPTRKEVVLAACDCAETALKYLAPGEERPGNAIAIARAWTEGKATLGEVRCAAEAAYAVVAPVPGACPAYSAGYAASIAYSASPALAASTAVTYAATSSYAEDSAFKHMADLVRARLYSPDNPKIVRKDSE